MRKLFNLHCFLITCLTFLLIWALDTLRLNLQFLNPFNKSLQNYTITDIVYSRLRDQRIRIDDRIVLVNTGIPDRDTLAKMIDRIAEAGPRVIGVDLLLDVRKPGKGDTLLRDCLRRHRNVVLGSRLSGYDPQTGRFALETDCDTFFSRHAPTGYTNFPTESRIIRVFSPSENTEKGPALSFATQIVAAFQPGAVAALLARGKAVEEIYYDRIQDNFFQFDTGTVLDTAVDLGKIMHDKIILIGYLGQGEQLETDSDRFYTPFNPDYKMKNLPDMYGLVIHANIISMVLDGKYVLQLSGYLNLLLTFILVYFNIYLFYLIYDRVSIPYPFITRLLQLLEIFILFFLVSYFFFAFRYRLDFTIVIFALVLTFDMIKFYKNILQRRLRIFKRIPEYPFEKGIKNA